MGLSHTDRKITIWHEWPMWLALLTWCQNTGSNGMEAAPIPFCQNNNLYQTNCRLHWKDIEMEIPTVKALCVPWSSSCLKNVYFRAAVNIMIKDFHFEAHLVKITGLVKETGNSTLYPQERVGYNSYTSRSPLNSSQTYAAQF